MTWTDMDTWPMDMDTFARALVIADKLLQSSNYKQMLIDRYSSFDASIGNQYESGKLTLEDLRDYAIKHGEPAIISGKQEWIENLINRYI